MGVLVPKFKLGRRGRCTGWDGLFLGFLVYLLLEQPRRHDGSEASLTSVPFLTAPFANDFPSYYAWMAMSYPLQLPLMSKPLLCYHPAREAILEQRT